MLNCGAESSRDPPAVFTRRLLLDFSGHYTRWPGGESPLKPWSISFGQLRKHMYLLRRNQEGQQSSVHVWKLLQVSRERFKWWKTRIQSSQRSFRIVTVTHTGCFLNHPPEEHNEEQEPTCMLLMASLKLTRGTREHWLSIVSYSVKMWHILHPEWKQNSLLSRAPEAGLQNLFDSEKWG